ncbi:SGNH/GDSL hydrolase family protein [Bordetella genomosp. 11]|uniref:GDSL family lipase n=1 Tax=Bordetella genomosp. 11 TaxID=1416808 RepID=A0A261UL97_9BORD|nr:SGNH/GDSL hydrolase family protein [Bordetella genomosp. 11]OZI62307.1 GDSL family lipase [Bordetella genomosp. 11]
MASRRTCALLAAALTAAVALAGGSVPSAARAQAAQPGTGPAITAAPKGNAAPVTGSAVAVSPANDRWAESLAAFAAADQAHPPTPGGVLFVGSSSIRLWNGLETEFQSLPVVVKRGFGGSRMLDCARHLHQLVQPYKPRLVLVYAGDNDLAEGRTPEQVLQAFTAFVDGVRETMPATRIAYISIKPSPSRAALMPEIRQANALIRDYTLKTRNTDFIDIYTPMLNAAGQPRAELFRDDQLHLNTQGYALWKRIITAHLN